VNAGSDENQFDGSVGVAKGVMAHDMKPKLNYVKRPDGTLLTPGNLPPTDLRRWVMRRKADIVMAVRGGLLSMEAACSRYGLSREEFLAWQKAFDHLGIKGLSGKGVQELQRVRNAERAARIMLKLPANDPGSSPTDANAHQDKRPKRAQR
jgi:hypothetical protein